MSIVEVLIKLLELIDSFMKTSLARKVRERFLVTPGRVRWTSADHEKGTGILVWDDSTGASRSQHWISWKDLRRELDQYLLPSLFADPSGFHFVTRDFEGKKDWLVQIVDSTGSACAEVWFGVDPDGGWAQDGLVRIGTSAQSPHVWQTYRRLSNGTYERLSSAYSDIEKVPAELKRIRVGS